MNHLLIRINFFLVLSVLPNHCLGMITALHEQRTLATTAQYTKDRKKENFLKKIRFFERLNNTSQLLLTETPFNFNFSEKLLPKDESCYFSRLTGELDTQIIALLIPDGIYNLNRTCKDLDEKLSFQKPYIWNIIDHNLHRITEANMPRLLTLATLHNKNDVQNRIYSIQHNEHSHFSCSDCGTNRFYPRHSTTPIRVFFHLLDNANRCPHHSDNFPPVHPLLLACYTGDITTVIDILKKKDCCMTNIGQSMDLAIEIDGIQLIPLLCKALKNLDMENLLFSHYIRWCNTARKDNKIKTFETLITCSKNYFLNEPNGDHQTYLDKLLIENADQVFIDIVKKHDGKTAEEIDNQEKICLIQ